MFERFAQFGIALLQLLEQPYILNRDGRLVRKGFEESNVLLRK
jgi:hypothetical protein